MTLFYRSRPQLQLRVLPTLSSSYAVAPSHCWRRLRTLDVPPLLRRQRNA